MVVVAGFYLTAVSVRILQFDVIWFVHLGREMLESSGTSSVLTPALGWESELGYDGQYYYALAVDPAKASEYMTDNAGIIYARPFYPALSRVLSLGQVGFVPYAMLSINVCAVLVGTFSIARWLDRKGASPWFAVLFGLYPGIVYSVFRDLTEPLAYSLVAAAILRFDPRVGGRVKATAVLLAVAALTRETVVLFSIVGTIALWSCGPGDVRWSWRRIRRPLAFLTATVAPLLIWKALVTLVVDEPAQGSPGGLEFLVPFGGLLSYWPWGSEQSLIALTIVVPTLLALGASTLLIASRGDQLFGVLLALNATAFVVFLPKDVYVDYGAASRAATGVVLATIVCVPAWRALPRWPRMHLVSVAWALPWYLLVASALGLSGIDLVTL